MPAENIQISIKGLKELRYTCLDPVEHFPELGDKKQEVEADLKVRYQWNIEGEMFGIYTVFSVYIFHEKKREKVIEYLCATHFGVANLTAHLKEVNEGEFTISKRLEEALLKMAIAHGRGMLTVKIATTRYRDFVFPLIDIGDIISNEIPGPVKIVRIEDEESTGATDS